MAWPFDERLLKILTGTHRMQARVDVFTQTEVRARNVRLLGGSITANLMSDVCRTGSLVVPKDLIDQGLFDPNADRVRVQTGTARYPITIFTGRVQQHTTPVGDRVTVNVADFGDDVVEGRFEQPWAPRYGNSMIAEMRRILRGVDVDFGLNVEPGIRDRRIPQGLAWNDNRAQALDELASAMSAIWQPGRTGEFRLFPNPFNLPDSPTPVLTLSDGPNGNLLDYVRTVSRESVYNSITLEVQRTGGGDPLRVTVRDTNPSSPTRWGGPFGKRNRRISVQTPLDRVTAFRVASRILRQSLALARSWQFSTPHFPLLDPGDVVVVDSILDGLNAHVIQSITYPLMALDRTTFTSQELRQFNEDAEDPNTFFYGGVE